MSSDKKIRLVCYPRVVGDQVKNFYGMFLVTFINGQPSRADKIDTFQMPEVSVALDTVAAMWDTLFNDDTLLCLQTVDGSNWDGTLHFEAAFGTVLAKEGKTQSTASVASGGAM